MKSASFSGTCSTLAAVASFLSATALATDVCAQDSDYLFFTTDVHNLASQAQDKIAGTCMWGETNHCELIGFVGDYNSGDPGTFDSTFMDMYSLLAGTLATLGWPSVNLLASQGNHDVNNTYYSGVSSGPAALSNNDLYEAYALHVKDFGSGSSLVSSYFSTYQSKKMVIILSHYPLHSTRLSAADQDAAKALFSTLQSLGQDYDITFLWGHNHRSESYDQNARLLAMPGQTIRKDGAGTSGLITDVANATLNFTYVNAGYVSNWAGTPTSTTISLYRSTMFIARDGYDPQYAFVPRCGNDTCKSGANENACNCYEDCGYATGSCSGACGGPGSGSCWCDETCEVFNDCCSDKQWECGCDHGP